jgi:hypothetical protein
MGVKKRHVTRGEKILFSEGGGGINIGFGLKYIYIYMANFVSYCKQQEKSSGQYFKGLLHEIFLAFLCLYE